MGLAAVARLLLYVIAGGLVGFLLLGEFALATLLPVLAVLAAIAVLSVIGGLGRVGLPRCTEVHAGIACLGGTRDVWTTFLIELVVFGLAAVASLLHLRLALVAPLRRKA